ncbi:hypothetical protein CONLIGDRAFT_687655 [Coniochaeta ligniaria NRRL 30616]|uniref:Uncharacterized protein n=1 Tax=Coniochaeta ligniaria NRRL 30616 TaxID=1408157 RepID=A0A1J7I4B7_9PEZI|nr:hypothetical protein CONLIGDRAFT_687655 [Coniochaeta ligniaria NRRL 30616]
MEGFRQEHFAGTASVLEIGMLWRWHIFCFGSAAEESVPFDEVAFAEKFDDGLPVVFVVCHLGWAALRFVLVQLTGSTAERFEPVSLPPSTTPAFGQYRDRTEKADDNDKSDSESKLKPSKDEDDEDEKVGESGSEDSSDADDDDDSLPDYEDTVQKKEEKPAVKKEEEKLAAMANPFKRSRKGDVAEPGGRYRCDSVTKRVQDPSRPIDICPRAESGDATGSRSLVNRCSPKSFISLKQVRPVMPASRSDVSATSAIAQVSKILDLTGEKSMTVTSP